GRAASNQLNAQHALDAAVLAASNVFLDDDEREDKFAAVFAKNFKEDDATISDLKFTFSQADGGYGRLELDYNTSIMKLFGKDTVHNVLASRARQNNVDLEIALVLDVSGSMLASMGSGSRMDALKTAAKKMVETLDDAKLPSQNIRYSIVPFTMNVNVGTNNAAFVDNTASGLFAGTAWAGCVLERPAPYHNQDVYNSGDASSGGRWQAYVWPPEPDNGTVCQNPSDGTNSGYKTVETVGISGTFDPWTKGANYNCVRHAIAPLTTSASDITNEIDALESHSNMGTILAPGIAWAHRVLSPSEPFSEGQSFSNNVRKIMIVITDGEQTTEGEFQSTGCGGESNTSTPYSFDPDSLHLDGTVLSTNGPTDMFTPYGYILDSQPFGAASTWTEVKQQLRTTSLDACSKFKARASGGSVELFTIAASSSAGPGTDVYSLLQECATSNEHFFYADGAQDLEDAFVAIAKEATDLRLTE
ncbi:MAG: hypothetical protein K0U34_00325, partial [Alphaproteobacteria bacterium]|nr:hypothetical protein [Alphaproteobacteria bacterium]